MKRITGHLSERNGKWYAVVNLYDTDGKRHEKWSSLDLPAKKGNKTEATHRLNQILEKYNTGIDDAAITARGEDLDGFVDAGRGGSAQQGQAALPYFVTGNHGEQPA